MNKYLVSSADATKYSTTFKGILMAVLPIIMIVSGLNEAELIPIIEAISNGIFLITSAIASLQIVFGLGRKIYLERWSAKTE
jgi:hypothetical protein